ncbi:MAG: hypothetical protein NTV58_09750 [Deltaproteobacteria bacterium]|nr:hypothetical protein [Deltaproteobacteria bacterium]
MIDSLQNQYLTYYYQVMSWYEGLTYVEQFFTLFGVVAVTAVVVSLYIIKKASS